VPGIKRNAENQLYGFAFWAFPLKKAEKTEELKALIAAEPDKDLRQMLQR